MFRKSIALLGAGLAMASLAFTPGATANARPELQAEYSKKTKRGLFNRWAYSGPSLIGSKGAGITMARQKRASQKKRNQAHHKTACRRNS